MPELTVYSSASEGLLYGETTTHTYSFIHDYATGSVYDSLTYIKIGQFYSAPSYYTINRGFLFFDTSGLPDDVTISQVVLHLYNVDVVQVGQSGWNLVVQNGQPTYPHDPLEIGDYLHSHYSGDGGSISSTDINTSGLGYFTITLNSTGRGWINKTGLTKFALRLSTDISSTPPAEGAAGKETTYLGTNERGSEYRAKLVITYAISPTVTTQAVSDINEIIATGNGNITDTGDENASKRGVCWNTTGSPTVADSKSEEIGSFGTGAFSRPMTGLIRGEKYYVKAYAYNSGGYGYGSEVNFYTNPAVTTQVPTDIIRADPTKVTANGLIELDVVEPITTRGFKYGLTETDTWDESENGGGTYSEGVFSLQLTLLTADTTYYIRAYAIGAWGTKYGSYLEFKTAYPYGANKTEITSEATASDADIAKVGGKRTLKIENHLIQNQTIADIVSAAYLADYKDQKTKLVVTRPTPAPYEIGDTITVKKIL